LQGRAAGHKRLTYFKDGKFGWLETLGIERLITGICTTDKDDEVRLTPCLGAFR
jgi:hypothetical protein